MPGLDLDSFRHALPGLNQGLPAVDDVVHEPASGVGGLASSAKGVLMGLAMVPIVSLCLFLSEGIAIETADALREGRASVREASVAAIDPALESRLVHVAGPVTTGAHIVDSLGVTVAGLQLGRAVEMYQWREDRRTQTVDGEKRTEIRYSKGWEGRAIDSSRFRADSAGTPRRNPPLALGSERLSAPNPKLGAYRLTPGLLATLPEGPALEPTPAIVEAVARAMKRPAAAANGAIIVGQNPAEPAIGDLRIRYLVSDPRVATAVAGQFGETLAPHKAVNGTPVAILRPGTHSPAAMFTAAEADNSAQRWAVRGACLVFIFVGFILIFRPLSALASFIPFLGEIVAAGSAMIAGALALATVLVVIAIAWLWYAPVLSILLIGGAIAALFGLKVLAARMRGNGAAPAAVG